jgi:hypothetical protein
LLGSTPGVSSPPTFTSPAARTPHREAVVAPALVAAVRTRGLAAAPCPSVSGDQPWSRCGHPISRSSFSPLVAPHSTAAAGLRAAEPHARAASPPHSSSGRAITAHTYGHGRCCPRALPSPPTPPLRPESTIPGVLCFKFTVGTSGNNLKIGKGFPVNCRLI